MRVHLFVPCLVDQFQPELAEASRQILTKAGCDVVCHSERVCCGQAPFNAGYVDQAKELALRFARVFGWGEPIVTPSGSCAAMIRKQYEWLLPDLSTDDATRLTSLGENTFELCEFLVKYRPAYSPPEGQGLTVAYHRACHAEREIGVAGAALSLLEDMDGINLKPLENADRCCGFGGMFSCSHSSISVAMAESKLDAFADSGAGVLVTGEPGCMLQLQGALDKRSGGGRVMHVAELLAGGRP
jgi:L-lactate dehydrogenase complex protein LldE